jgi:hypothetical protein
MKGETMPSANVIQLRQLLSEKFPGLRLQLNSQSVARRLWPTGLPQIDQPLGGGLPKGALAEVVSAAKSSGSATLLRTLLFHAAARRQIVTLIDSHDSLDVTQIDEENLSRLLWVRCRSAEEAMKAADLVLRDANLPMVLVDLKMAPLAQLRRISATTWYRFQRLVEETDTTCLVFTPAPMVGPEQTRIDCSARFSLEALDRDTAECARELKLEVTDLRHGAVPEMAQLNTA